MSRSHQSERSARRGNRKRYQDLLLFLLVLGITGQGLVVVVDRMRPSKGLAAPPESVLVGDTVHSLTGYSGAGVLTAIPFVADPGTVTVLYAFHSECAHCHTVAPAWASHFSDSDPATSTVRRIALTRDLPGPAADYAARAGWKVDLLSVSQLTPTNREYSLVSKTPWVFVFDSRGVLRFQDHGSQLERVEQAVSAISSDAAQGMFGASR